MMEPGGKGVKYREGRVQRNAGLVRGGVRDLIHFHESLCDGGAVMDLDEVLARHNVAVVIVYGDRRHYGCGAVVVIIVRAWDLEWCDGRICLWDILVAVLIEVGVQAAVIVDLSGELSAEKTGGVELVRVRLVVLFGDEVVNGQGISLRGASSHDAYRFLGLE